MPGLETDLDLLKSAVCEAGKIALKFFGGQYKRWTKEGGSPVTEADLAVDTFLKNRPSGTSPLRQMIPYAISNDANATGIVTHGDVRLTLLTTYR